MSEHPRLIIPVKGADMNPSELDILITMSEFTADLVITFCMMNKGQFAGLRTTGRGTIKYPSGRINGQMMGSEARITNFKLGTSGELKIGISYMTTDETAAIILEGFERAIHKHEGLKVIFVLIDDSEFGLFNKLKENVLKLVGPEEFERIQNEAMQAAGLL